jgi:hypothetical protein
MSGVKGAHEVWGLVLGRFRFTIAQRLGVGGFRRPAKKSRLTCSSSGFLAISAGVDSA